MMASHFVNHFRNTFLVASTATLAQAIESSISPRFRHLHYVTPPPPPPQKSAPCLCGSAAAVEAVRSQLWRSSTAPLGIASAGILASNGSGPRGGANGDKPPKQGEGRGEAHNLRTVMHYFERVMPLMFDSQLFFLKYNPPQLYTPNVILENHLREPTKTIKGLPMLVLWQNFFRLSYTWRYITNRLIILSQWIEPEEGTVTINFRILSLRKSNALGAKEKEDLNEHLNKLFAKDAEWHDYLLTLHVTNHNRVWKVVISQKNPERTPKLMSQLTNPLFRLRRRVNQGQELPLPV